MSICVATVPRGATYYWQRTFALKDNHQYFNFSFQVPEGVGHIRAVLRYLGESGNYLGLYLYDCSGFRAYGRTENNNGLMEVTAEVDCQELLPGAVPGPVSGGEWQVEITTSAIKTLCAYQLEIELLQGKDIQAKAFAATPMDIVLERQARWYRGDFHVHSLESDGRKSVAELLGIAREKGLDFLSLTDHNSIANWWKLPQQTDVLPIKGLELTTFYGHANALGVEQWVDWRTGKNGRNINQVADEVHQKGGLFSINHPCTPDLPEGHAAWQYHDLDWNLVDVLEVWNAPVFSRSELANRQCRGLWDRLLNAGFRITGIGGSDAHYLPGSMQPLGLPLNYVYASELSREGILEAVKAGRVFVTTGPEIFFQGMNAGGYVFPGGRIPSHGGPINLQAEIRCNGFRQLLLRLVGNGRILEEVELDEEVNDYHCQTPGRRGDWYRLELVTGTSREESLAAFTNPVFVY